MPYETVWEKHGTVWTFFGEISFEEIDKANKEFYSDKRSDNCKYQIFNGIQVTNITMDKKDTLVTACSDSGASMSITNVKVALVGGPDELIKLYEEYINISKKINRSWQFKIFESLEMAKQWVSS